MVNNNAQEALTEKSPLDETEPLWTVVEVARYLQLEPETVRSMARRKELPGLKVGRVWRFHKAEVIHALGSENNI